MSIMPGPAPEPLNCRCSYVPVEGKNQENKHIGHCRAMMNAHVMHGDIAGASIWADRAIDMALGQQK